MKNKIIFGLIFILAYGIHTAYGATLGAPEIIMLLVAGLVFFGFFGGIFMLIYFLIKKNRNTPLNTTPNTVAINFAPPLAYQNPTVEEKSGKKETIKVNARIALPQQNEIRYVNTDEIMRCEADNNYTNFFFSDGGQLLISKSLKEYSDLLKPQGFVRTHQSHLVNPKFVKSWLKEDGGTLLMDSGDKIPVSKPNRELVKEILGK
ncbi:LytTR family DNA-binding domain-containing protein [Pedobacter sp. SG908]|uniref:LytR/AlgR family response regulator transcription factor n=1 Tax=Pedobacter sp. SG908 TaxID=2587135 RepID=UPI0014213E58|nr:LytTR family DNA-binding domain-containing protein [Pedobacter sp. SG908]NII84610.1 DNA-binding LytR/AlgR family response regulator [Pedobacter sp. SG908]